MKRLLILLLALGLSAGLYARDDSGGGGGGHDDHDASSADHHEASSRPSSGGSHSAQHSHAGGASHQSHGGQAGSARHTGQAHNGAPQYHAQHNSAAIHGGQAHVQARIVTPRLHNLGISHVPKAITNRSRILSTSRAQSVIGMPHTGFDGHAITSVSIGAHDWNRPVVRAQMNLVIGDHARIDAIGRANLVETQRDHYYWHHDAGFDYCHYYDPWGYHWYGWYLGSSYFWTRYYADRWWFYDPAFDRWCFYNGGGWWWQDPALGSLYVYDNGQYVASDDGSGQAASSAPAQASAGGSPLVSRSSDGTRMVKIMGDSQDAFLYDTAIPPSFSPLYLASKVQGVKFSDTSNGKPLQIMVTLSDGTFDIFDAQGESMNFSDGQSGGGAAAPSGPPQGGNPPAPNN